MDASLIAKLKLPEKKEAENAWRGWSGCNEDQSEEEVLGKLYCLILSWSEPEDASPAKLYCDQ